MDIKFLDSEDIQAKMQLGLPISIQSNFGIESCKVYPFKYDEIVSLGINKYSNSYVNMFCLKTSEIIKLQETDKNNEFVKMRILSLYDFWIKQSKFNKGYQEHFKLILKLFLKKTVEFQEDLGIFYIEEFIEGKIITEALFNTIGAIIKRQNYIFEKEDIRARSKKLAEMKQKIADMKKKYNLDKDKGISLPTIISSVCSKHPSINLLNIGGLSLYGIYDQYVRLNLIDRYEIGMNALLQGASKEDVDLQHWTSDIKDIKK